MALSVLLHDAAQRDRVSDILETFNPVDIDEEGLVEPAIMTPPPAAGTTPGLGDRFAGTGTGAPGLTREGEQVIPVIKEELEVGKRASERRYRIHTYVVETPVGWRGGLLDLERAAALHR